MKEKYEKLTTNTIIFAIGSFGSKIISFFLVPLYTHVLSTSGLGTAELVLTIVNLLVPIISLSVGEAILFYGLREKENKSRILINGLIILLFGTILLALTYPLLELYAPIRGYTWYIIVYVIITSLCSCLLIYTKACENNLLFSISSIIHSLMICLFNLFFLLYLRIGENGYLLAFLLADLFLSIILFIKNKIYRDFLHFEIDWQLIKSMLAYSLPLILNSISWSVAHSTDKIMIEAMKSVDDVAIYSVASKIPTLINSLTGFFCQAWTMSAILEYNNKDSNFYSKTFSGFCMILFTASSCIMMILKPFMSIYVGQNFNEAWRYVPFLLIAAIFQNFTIYFGSIIQSANKNIILLVSSLISCFSNIALNFILIPIMGIQGAVIGTLLSYILGTLIRCIITHNIISFDMHIVRTIISLSIIVIQAMAVVSEIYVWPISLASIILLVFLHYKEIYAVLLMILGMAKGKIHLLFRRK